MMRVAMIGLCLPLMFGGGAEAKECRLDGATLVVTSPKDEKSDLGKGDRYKVLRVSSRFQRLGPGTFRPGTIAGSIYVEIEGPKGRFVVDQDYIPGTSPWVTAVAWPASDPKVKPNWRRRNHRQERRLYGPDGTLDVYSGPLGRVALRQLAC